MGWFDDNHPMGQAAEDRMNEAMDSLSEWQKDPPKATSSRLQKRVERPGAEWGQSLFNDREWGILKPSR